MGGKSPNEWFSSLFVEYFRLYFKAEFVGALKFIKGGIYGCCDKFCIVAKETFWVKLILNSGF